MKLTLDLTASEEANIAGWLNYYKANPQYVGVPSGPTGPNGPEYQTRIVLEAQTRERYDEIAAQFAAGPPSDLQLVVCELYESPPHVQKDVNLYVDVGYVYAIPIRCPYSEMTYEWSLAEFGSEPLRHRAKLSLTAGDLAGTEGNGDTVPILRWQVSNAGPYMPGSIVYANVALAVGVDRGHQTHYSCIQR